MGHFKHTTGYILKTIYLFRQLLYLGFHLRYRGNDDARLIMKAANGVLSPHNLSLDLKFYKPIRHYTTGLRITNLWFSTLRGYACSNDEIMAGRYLGAMTPLFDELFDANELCERGIRDAISSDYPDNEIIIILQAFRERLLGLVKNREFVGQTLDKIIESQLSSLRQKSHNITHDEISQITFDKGGNALLACRSILDHPMDEIEENAVYKLGALVQMCNDVFDVLEDTQKGIKTMVDGIPDLTSFKSEYQDLIISVMLSFGKANYKKSNLRKFYTQMMLIISRGLVCIDHLQKSQRENNGVFDPSNMSREQLICDMEKPGNLLKSIKYTLRTISNHKNRR